MSATQPIFLTVPPRSWRELVLPKEHGSWAFAFEPIALGLLIAPSPAGGWLALAMAVAQVRLDAAARIIVADDAGPANAVKFTTVQGDVVSFVVRLMACAPDGDRVLSRFDTAHGIAHQDVLAPDGNLREKYWLPHLNFDEALSHAIHHFKTHPEDYPG